MKKKIISIVATVLMAAGLSSAAFLEPAAAVRCPDGKTEVVTIADCPDFSDAEGHDTDLMKVLTTIINVITGVVGLLAVIMIIIGGINYTLSSGDASKVTKAKNTIMYGIIGLAVALLAFAIVNFVLVNVFGA